MTYEEQFEYLLNQGLTEDEAEEELAYRRFTWTSLY